MEGISRKPDTQFDGHDLPWLIEEYLNDCERRVQKKTCYTYRMLLDYFLTWWAEVGPAQNYTLRRSDFHVFIQWLQTQSSYRSGPIAFNTIKKTLVLVKQTFNFAYRGGYTTRNYAVWVPKAKGRPLPKQAPDPSCIVKLFNACDASLHPVRNKAMLAVLAGTGVRRAECVGIDIEEVKFFADKPGGQITIKHGKNDKERIVFFDGAAGDYITAQINALADNGCTTGPLFVGYRGERIRAKSMNGIIDNIVELAGLSDVIHGPHDLRRLFATFWTRNNRGVGYLQPLSMQLGHSTTAMTMYYSKQDTTDLEQTFISPLAMLKK